MHSDPSPHIPPIPNVRYNITQLPTTPNPSFRSIPQFFSDTRHSTISDTPAAVDSHAAVVDSPAVQVDTNSVVDSLIRSLPVNSIDSVAAPVIAVAASRNPFAAVADSRSAAAAVVVVVEGLAVVVVDIGADSLDLLLLVHLIASSSTKKLTGDTVEKDDVNRGKERQGKGVVGIRSSVVAAAGRDVATMEEDEGRDCDLGKNLERGVDIGDLVAAVAVVAAVADEDRSDDEGRTGDDEDRIGEGTVGHSTGRERELDSNFVVEEAADEESVLSDPSADHSAVVAVHSKAAVSQSIPTNSTQSASAGPSAHSVLYSVQVAV